MEADLGGIFEGVLLVGVFFLMGVFLGGRVAMTPSAAALAEGVLLRPLPILSGVEGFRWLRREGYSPTREAALERAAGVVLRPRETFFAFFDLLAVALMGGSAISVEP